VLLRDEPARISFAVDELSLYRRVGSAQLMAEQCRHLLEVAAMPNVTMQVLPATAHPANASAFIVTDSAAWCEHVAGGFAYVTEETLTRLVILFDTLRGESFRVSESAAMMRKAPQRSSSSVRQRWRDKVRGHPASGHRRAMAAEPRVRSGYS
jgi:hypothetical protein